MKINIEQLDTATRTAAVKALNEYADRWVELLPNLSTETRHLAKKFEHCVILVCEYINTDAEKGGNHGL